MSIIVPFPPDGPIPPSTTPPPDEIALLRQNTSAFIAADPLELMLEPQMRAQTPDGGYTLSPGEPRDLQIFRLIPQSDRMPEVQTPDGFQLTPTYILLGDWDCEMERWDRFSFWGVDFIITSPIRPDYRTEPYWYERKGDVARF